MSGLGHRLEQLRTKLMEIESLSNRIKNLERRLERIENGRDGNHNEGADEPIVWRSLDELRGVVERLSVAVTQLESEVQTMTSSISHLDDD